MVRVRGRDQGSKGGMGTGVRHSCSLWGTGTGVKHPTGGMGTGVRHSSPTGHEGRGGSGYLYYHKVKAITRLRGFQHLTVKMHMNWFEKWFDDSMKSGPL